MNSKTQALEFKVQSSMFSAPVKAGKVLWMKVSYSEGVATHTDSESCIFVGDGEDEALTGVRAGQPLSREIEPPSRKRWPLWGADAIEPSGRQDWSRSEQGLVRLFLEIV
jgi:hypothetical protein